MERYNSSCWSIFHFIFFCYLNLFHYAFPLKPRFWYGTIMLIFTQIPKPEVITTYLHLPQPTSVSHKSCLFCLLKSSNLSVPFHSAPIGLHNFLAISWCFPNWSLCFLSPSSSPLSQHWPQPYLSPAVKVIFLINWFYCMTLLRWILTAFRIQFRLHGLCSGIWPVTQLSFFDVLNLASLALYLALSTVPSLLNYLFIFHLIMWWP